MQKVDLLLRTKVLLKANFINLDDLSYYRTWNLFVISLVSKIRTRSVYDQENVSWKSWMQPDS